MNNIFCILEPIVKNGKVIGFNSMWKPGKKCSLQITKDIKLLNLTERPFPIDMAGFAISFDLLGDFH